MSERIKTKVKDMAEDIKEKMRPKTSTESTAHVPRQRNK